MSGRFITFEGIDGAGKSSAVGHVATLLQARGIESLITREPGGTAAGERIRKILLDRDSALLPETEALLVFAGRWQHLHEVILPALARGIWVLCDRFTDATIAYQGGGRGVSLARLEALKSWVQQGREPDLTLLFDTSVDTAGMRLQGRGDLDRFELESRGFHGRVRDAYLELARRFPSRITVIDSNHTPDAIKNTLEDIIATYCNSV
ncbi:MAG: dTMP kinase [Burkholderiales bacterium]